MKKLYLVTGNMGKAQYASKLLGLPVQHYKTDIDEIQSLDLQEVVSKKLHSAYKEIGQPTIVEDVSLEIGGKRMPGTLIKFFIEEYGLDELCRMFGQNPKALAKCVIGYKDSENEKYFAGELYGSLASEPRGENGFGRDKIFIPDGFNQTRAEMNSEDDERTYLKFKRFDLLRDFIVEKSS